MKSLFVVLFILGVVQFHFFKDNSKSLGEEELTDEELKELGREEASNAKSLNYALKTIVEKEDPGKILENTPGQKVQYATLEDEYDHLYPDIVLEKSDKQFLSEIPNTEVGISIQKLFLTSKFEDEISNSEDEDQINMEKLSNNKHESISTLIETYGRLEDSKFTGEQAAILRLIKSLDPQHQFLQEVAAQQLQSTTPQSDPDLYFQSYLLQTSNLKIEEHQKLVADITNNPELSSKIKLMVRSHFEQRQRQKAQIN